MSQYNIEQLYNKLCYQIIKNQENEKAKYNMERSWGVLKSAINVWILNRLVNDRYKAYNSIVNEILKGQSLKTAIEKVLISFREINIEFLKKKNERKMQIQTVDIPPQFDWFTINYKKIEIGIRKSAMSLFYMDKEISSVEKQFIYEVLEKNKNIEWWYKNSDNGQNYFSVIYNNQNLFYPDWFVKIKNGKILILDTKGGWTLEYDTKEKIEALHKFLKIEKLNKKYKAGIVVYHSNIWKVNTNEIYNNEDFYDINKIINF